MIRPNTMRRTAASLFKNVVMKQILFLIVALIAAISLSAQNNDTFFTNSLGEQFKVVKHSDLNSNRYAYAIECSSTINGKGLMWKNGKDVSKFCEALKKLQLRYTHLHESAKMFTNVRELKERIKVKFPKTQFRLGDRPYGTGCFEAEFSTLNPGGDYVLSSAYVDEKNIGFSDRRLQSNLFSIAFCAPQDIDKLIYAMKHCPNIQSEWPK